MKYQRTLDLLDLLGKKSFFLFGPRSTGKSYLVRQQLEGRAEVIDLLRADLYLRLSQNPSELEALLSGIVWEGKEGDKVVVIDEVQKVPALLDEVHRLIEARQIRFLLTGSSARKLKRGGGNMLAGRAWVAQLFPLTWFEIPTFNLDRYLLYGGLPQVYPSEQPLEELDTYVQTYLKEEILVEGLIRKMPPFSRFLKSAALSSGQQLNFTQLGADCHVSPSTVREYYSILEDTLVGFLLEPWAFSKKRKAVQTAKFYFFDPGVTHALAGTRSIDRNSSLYGSSFEQFMGLELRAYLSYRRMKLPLTFWRSRHGYEVDFLIGDEVAIEVKSTAHVSSHHLRGLQALSEEKVFRAYYMVSHDRLSRQQDGITCLPWETFLQKLWRDEIFPGPQK